MTVRTAMPRPAAAGFTLVELMVTMGIAAILAAIALPAYNTAVRKSRRTEAKTALLDLAGREERYFNTNNAYTATPSNLGYGTGAFPMAVGSGYYTVSVAVTAGAAGVLPTYTISAVPATTDQLKDTACLSFTLTNTGLQGATTMPTCWQ
ncbi:MAG: type IV pilin protein [Steroidobacteraceae bacterium]|jgi:type IV pilus assembly protein PilE